jgi:hypothetical protein
MRALLIILLALMLSSCYAPAKINGVRFRDHRGHTVPQKEKNILLFSFVIGYGLSVHFININIK